MAPEALPGRLPLPDPEATSEENAGKTKTCRDAYTAAGAASEAVVCLLSAQMGAKSCHATTPRAAAR